MITQERLKEVLDYNPETGVFQWRECIASNAPAGAIAGTPLKKGYIKISVDDRGYLAHRLAILYTDGYLPENTVDHIDRVPWHNSRLNLREASQQCQSRNCGLNKNNTSGLKGVFWDNGHGKWGAQIVVGGKNKRLGLFGSIIEAAYVRYAAEQCLGFQDCDQNSTAKKYIKEQGGICQ